jgi:hypothetical protein
MDRGGASYAACSMGWLTMQELVAMGRHERRASVSEFKRVAATGHLDVHLVPTEDIPLSDPLLQRAASHWRAGIAARRPTCISCKAKFADGAQAGAFVMTVPSAAPTSASASALCDACWSALDDAQVNAAALKIVRRVLPNATFDAEPPR